MCATATYINYMYIQAKELKAAALAAAAGEDGALAAQERYREKEE